MFFVAILQVHIIELAFVKLGLTTEDAAAILLGTLLGSVINLPIYSVPRRLSENTNENLAARITPPPIFMAQP
jgi:uncharacterized membrane protein